jgi:hypothetical protein
MKRWTIRILVFLLLGAIVNIAVAWGIALSWGGDSATYDRAWGSTPPWLSKPDAMSTQDALWLSTMGHDWKHPSARYWYRIEVVRAVRRGVRQNSYYESRELMPHRDSWSSRNVQTIHPFAIELCFGWPFESLADALSEDTSGGSYHVGRWIHRRGITIETERDRLALPLQPLWPGFAINTVFYAAVLWLLLAAPFALRKWRRIRRGLCPKCGYDLRGRNSRTCPECGATR